jgi:4-hydroxy-tetrahydrodipicolinate reductase
MRGLAERKQAGLLYGTNFSVGVQVMLRLTRKMAELLKDAGYEFSIEETHHTSKLDSPSGTAMSLAKVVADEVMKGRPPGTNQFYVGVESKRVGDAAGIHVLTAKSDADKLVLTHESHSRRGFAEGAVRAAEWLSSRTGCYDFQDVYTEI